MAPAGICINLVCNTKNKVIIAASSNDIQRITYRNMYHSGAILEPAINPYERCASALDQSRSTLAGGYDNYWKVNCYVFVCACCPGRCYCQLCLEIIVHQAILGDLCNPLLSFENCQLPDLATVCLVTLLEH